MSQPVRNDGIKKSKGKEPVICDQHDVDDDMTFLTSKHRDIFNEFGKLGVKIGGILTLYEVLKNTPNKHHSIMNRVISGLFYNHNEEEKNPVGKPTKSVSTSE